jgi:hypothetical protein
MGEAHRQPTHPAVRAPSVSKRQGLADCPLVAYTTGAIMTLPHTRGALLVTPQIQHMLQTGVAMACSSFHALPPTPFVRLLHLPIGQPLAPAPPRTTPPPWGRGPMAEYFQEGRRVAGQGIGETRRQVPCAKTSGGILPHSQGLVIGPFAHPHGHPQLAVSGHGGMSPPGARFPQCMLGAAFLLFFTTLHCSSNANAMGLRARTCGSGKRSA